MSTETHDDTISALARKIGAEQQKRIEQDPHGFHGMSERELIDWMGRGNAQPGFVVYKHAELVLQMKQRESERRARQHDEVRRRSDRRMQQWSDTVLERAGAEWVPEPRRDGRLSPEHFTVLGFVLTTGLSVTAVAGAPIGGASAVAMFVLLAAGPVRRHLVWLLDQVVG